MVGTVTLVRFDLNTFGSPSLSTFVTGNESTQIKTEEVVSKPRNKAELLSTFALPPDSVVKLKSDGKLIPWSLLPVCDDVEIQILRPHQHVKPGMNKYIESDELFRGTVQRLESRVRALEEASIPAILNFKLERDLEIFSKQIGFLTRRMTEAEKADWVKNPK